MTKRITKRQAAEYIRNREEFQISTGSLRGFAAWSASFGKLPEADVARYREQRCDVDYTVMSYGTPIAWHVSGSGWTIPDVKYSRTTSAHQGIARRAMCWPDRLTEGAVADAARTGRPASDILTQINDVLGDSLPSAEQVRESSRVAVEAEGFAIRVAAEHGRSHYGEDDFAPDNGASVRYDAAKQMRDMNSDGAIYSHEYLARKNGYTPA